MKTYVSQLDYLKSLFIILMILFHLVYIGDTYPYMKQVVYTFHMPIFLILSGYLSDTEKSSGRFARSLWWLFVPYAVMETGYVFVASFVPVREHIGELSVASVFKRIFLDPVGPYWYLHTLLLCRTIHYVVARITAGRLSTLSFLIVTGLCFWGFAEGLSLVQFGYAMFFLMGVVLRRCGQDILRLCQPTAWSAVPLVILCCYPANLLGFQLSGVVITYLVISLSLWIYRRMPSRAIQVSRLIGRNTLAILLFSPVFTMLSRFYLPVFSFDPSGICFATFTVPLTLCGCLAITWCMDKVRCSQWFFGKERALQI